MRFTFVFITGCLFFAGSAFAQEDNITSATSSLQSVLSNLKDSVEQLTADNDQLAAKDKYVNKMVLELQMQLGNLEAQGEVLNKSTAGLQEANPRRSQEITRLEQDNYDLDDRIQKAQGGIKLIEKSLDAGYQEDQKLLLQLKGTAIAPPPAPVQSPETQAAIHSQKEKLKLMKMIYDSQQRQDLLHEAILDFQKNAPLLPGATALAHQQLLKEQIKDLEAQIAAYPPEKVSANFGYSNQWDDTQVGQLELELKTLEKNYSQLKNLMDQMSKKAQSTQTTVSQRVEAQKLQGSIDDLNRQAEGLRAELDDLRSQMVDLDKRKSHLETIIQQLP